MKFEAKTKDRENRTYGVWNNDMQAFQYVAEWNGSETLSLVVANEMAERLNRPKKQAGTFGGMGMGTF